jgi:hypothetical protein
MAARRGKHVKHEDFEKHTEKDTAPFRKDPMKDARRKKLKKMMVRATWPPLVALFQAPSWLSSKLRRSAPMRTVAQRCTS